MELRLKLGEVLWRKVFQPHLFKKDAEPAHLYTIEALERFYDQRLLWVLKLLYRSPHYHMPVNVFGTIWRNPDGWPAGFLKQAEWKAAVALAALGAGSIEFGTFPPLPQPGNQPADGIRVWRFPRYLAVINWFGFNSVGSKVGAARTGELHKRHRLGIPIGISIGKNKDTKDEDTVKDYLKALADFLPVLRPQDWVKINISSPNTEGLRDIFRRLDEFLGEFVAGARALAAEGGYPCPRFVIKVPPLIDMPREDPRWIVKIAAANGVVGIEDTNTVANEELKKRYGFVKPGTGEPLPGGVSGEPLRELTIETLAAMKDAARETGIDLVGVGGISQSWHVEDMRVKGGVKAIQILTGRIFRGPILSHEILAAWR